MWGFFVCGNFTIDSYAEERQSLTLGPSPEEKQSLTLDPSPKERQSLTLGPSPGEREDGEIEARKSSLSVPLQRKNKALPLVFLPRRRIEGKLKRVKTSP
jgi:hypothetical protein